MAWTGGTSSSREQRYVVNSSNLSCVVKILLRNGSMDIV